VGLRGIAARLGITERSADGIVTDLAAADYVVKEKDGRRNRYQIQAHLPLQDPAGRERTVRRRRGPAFRKGPARYRAIPAWLTGRRSASRRLAALVQPQPAPGALGEVVPQRRPGDVPDDRWNLPGQALVYCCLLGRWAQRDPDAAARKVSYQVVANRAPPTARRRLIPGAGALAAAVTILRCFVSAA
jgi:hypothetical protein